MSDADNREWDHNLHYHHLLLAVVPQPCRRALDVGCGHGVLAAKLAARCENVTGIDLDAEALTSARANASTNQTLLTGDAMTYPFRAATFDFITAVATLHHLPLRPALARFDELLAPGGILAIVGLYCPHTRLDHLWSVAGLAASHAIGFGRARPSQDTRMTRPEQTLAEILSAVQDVLPGAGIERRLLHRYTLIWTKPVNAAAWSLTAPSILARPATAGRQPRRAVPFRTSIIIRI